MLSDGSIIDSASLPPNAVESYPVTFTGASLGNFANSGQDLGSILGIREAEPSSLTATPASGARIPYGTSGEIGSVSGHPVMDSGSMLSSGGLINSGDSLNQTAITVAGSTPGFQFSPDPPQAAEHPLMVSGMSMSATDAAPSAMESQGVDTFSQTGDFTEAGSTHSSRRPPQEYPLTFSGGSAMDSMMGSGEGTLPGSVSGHPVHDSLASVSAAGYPLSTGGAASTGILQSASGPVSGHPVTMTEGSEASSRLGRGNLVRLSDGSQVYSSYAPSESVANTGYMESQGLEPVPQQGLASSLAALGRRPPRSMPGVVSLSIFVLSLKPSHCSEESCCRQHQQAIGLLVNKCT